MHGWLVQLESTGLSVLMVLHHVAFHGSWTIIIPESKIIINIINLAF